MRAGRLDRRVTIDEAVDVQDTTTGAVSTSWAPMAQVWAEIKPLKGRERLVDGGILAEADTLITIRAMLGVALNAKHRVRHIVNGITQIYNVVNPSDNMLDHRYIELVCKSGQNQG